MVLENKYYSQDHDETVTSLPNRQCPEQGRFFFNKYGVIYIYIPGLCPCRYICIYIYSPGLCPWSYVCIYIYIDQDLVLGVTYAYIVQDFVLGVMYINMESYIYIDQDSVLYTPCLWSYKNMRSLVP